MTEQEWLTSTDPNQMLRLLDGHTWMVRNLPGGGIEQHRASISERKLRLFACACCERVSADLGKDARYCMELERGPAKDAFNWAMGWAGDQKVPTQEQRAALLREIVDNPWKPVTLADPVDWMGFPPGPHHKLPRSWLTPPVLALARDAYDSRDFAALPVLWDALSEAGCQEERIRLHCLEPLHVRGCWLIDLLTGNA